MILEGLVTTLNADGEPHVAPMGPVVNRELTTWCLRPFKTSTTYANLSRTPSCSFCVTDDVLTLTKLVLKQPVDLEFLQKADSWVIASACHWYSLRIDKWDLSSARTEAEATVVDQGVMRPFWGWNRAKHALLEAAILMTRLQILDPAFVRCELERLAPAIDKTAGADEFEAWQLIQKHWDQFEPTQPLETTVEPNGP